MVLDQNTVLPSTIDHTAVKSASNYSIADKSQVLMDLAFVISQEAQTLSNLAQQVPGVSYDLVQQIFAATGKIVFSGMGKSGWVARKLVATFSSLGISAFFLHPTEAVHGDLGAVQSGDLFIALSKSGTGWEFEYILPVLQARSITTALLCCSMGNLTDKVDIVVKLPFQQEACALGLAPTSSSTMMMAYGDALAVVVSRLKRVTKQDFARNHPAGALGKKLLLTVRSFMIQSDALPIIAPEMTFQETVFTITNKKCGVGMIVDAEQQLLGIITDGDLRRACARGPEVFAATALDIATRKPKTLTIDVLAYVALETMEEFNITSLVVLDQGRVAGLVHIHDLIKAGLKG